MDTEVNSSAFTCFNNFFLNLLANFSHHFFNSCRVDSAVCHKLVEGEASDFTAYGVKAGEHYRFRSIINDDFNTCSSLKSTDITSFATDDATFYFVGINMEDGHGVFNSRFCGNTLDRLDNYSFCFLVCSHFCFVHNIVDIRSGSGLGLIFERLYEFVLRFLGRKAGDRFKFLAFGKDKFVQLFFASIVCRNLCFKACTHAVQFVFSTLVFTLLLVQLNFTLFEFCFLRL